MHRLRSDNTAGVSSEIRDALCAAGAGEALPYGEDAATARLQGIFAEVFECACVVIPVTSGVAANGLGLSLLAGPLDSVLCHERAHVARSEAGAVEFFSDGARLVPLSGPSARIEVACLRSALEGTDETRPGLLPPRAISLSQTTEAGTVYTLGHVKSVADAARARGMGVHMDGARFANALAALGCTPADASWRAGIDVLSFGATKNGAMSADALVVFDLDLAANLSRRQRRSGQLISKMRFLSCQLEAYLHDGLWLRNAARANAAAASLAQRLETMPGFEIVHPVESNMIFVRIQREIVARLAREGLSFRQYATIAGTDALFRLVTSFATREEEIEEIASICAAAAA